MKELYDYIIKPFGTIKELRDILVAIKKYNGNITFIEIEEEARNF